MTLDFLDWNRNGRSQTVEALGAVLDTGILSAFQNGTYLYWTLTGNLRFRFTSGVFFGSA